MHEQSLYRIERKLTLLLCLWHGLTLDELLELEESIDEGNVSKLQQQIERLTHKGPASECESAK